MMKTSLRKIESKGKTVWMTRPDLQMDSSLKKRRKKTFTSFQAALEKNADFETLLRIAEDFGKELFEDQIETEEDNEWTMTDWIDPVVKNVFNPMGAAGAFTKITEKEAHSRVFRCPSEEESMKDNSWASCLFSYGFTRGLLRSVFPEGEVFIGKTMNEGAPMCEFIFKAQPTEKEKVRSKEIKKEWSKRYQTLMKKR